MKNIEKIANVIIKPQRISLLHLYALWVNDNMVDLVDDLKNLDAKDIGPYFEFIRSNLTEYGIVVEENKIPNFSIIENCHACENCAQCTKLSLYVDWLEEQQRLIIPLMIHSTFQVLMLNKIFLRDIHERLAQFIQLNKEYLHKIQPEEIDENGLITRCNYWPTWLKNGIFFRDRGVCTICRVQLTGDLNMGIDPEMDHIVPLAKYGTNDSSNIQILCNKCNNAKLHHSSATSSYDIPLWNIYKEDISKLLD